MNDMIGHNLPDEFEALQDRTEALVANANRWLKERPVITDDDMAGKCSDFLEQVTGHLNEVKTAHDDEKAPHLKAGREVDDKYRPLTALLDAVKDKLNPLKKAWLLKLKKAQEEEAKRKEQEALAAIEAAEKAKREAEQSEDVIGATVAAEEAERAANRAVKEATTAARAKPQAKGAYGKRASGLRSTWVGDITNQDYVYERYKNNAAVREVLVRLVNADVRSGERKIAGVRIHETFT